MEQQLLVSGTEIGVQAIGSVVADEVSPSFDCFRFKALADEYVYPGALVATAVSPHGFLVGRVTCAIEVNPQANPSRISVRHAMDIKPDYPEEGLSTIVYRVYEADVIEQGLTEGAEVKITEPSDMAKAGADVFLPSEEVIAHAIGFALDAAGSLCLGQTRIATRVDENREDPNNVLLKADIIQRHIFIGGSTGSGKSWAAAVTLEEISKLGVPIVVLDSQHEYRGVTESLGGRVFRPGIDYFVRLSSLTEEELSDLVPNLRNTPGLELLIFTFLRLRHERQAFGLRVLVAGMEQDGPMLDLQPRSAMTALSRVRASIERHRFFGEPTDWADLFRRYSVINIDCGELDRAQLQLVVGASLRDLLRQREAGTVPPFVAVLDEAHLLVPEHEDSPCKQVIRENLRMGRHYGICVVLITQSPADIDKKTIRQCNTRLIFPLEPDQLDSLRGVRADATDEMLTRLPKMPQGTCILSGTYETIRHAVPIRIRSDRKTKYGGVSPNILTEIAKWKGTR